MGVAATSELLGDSRADSLALALAGVPIGVLGARHENDLDCDSRDLLGTGATWGGF
jgi:hypothetical protein